MLRLVMCDSSSHATSVRANAQNAQSRRPSGGSWPGTPGSSGENSRRRPRSCTALGGSLRRRRRLAGQVGIVGLNAGAFGDVEELHLSATSRLNSTRFVYVVKSTCECFCSDPLPPCVTQATYVRFSHRRRQPDGLVRAMTSRRGPGRTRRLRLDPHSRTRPRPERLPSREIRVPGSQLVAPADDATRIGDAR